MKMTQKEIVVRYLVAQKGEWKYGYEIVKNATSVIGQDYIIQDGDTRAHELARDGFYDSPNNRYIIQHRRKGKYAQFRALKGNPVETPASINQTALQFFKDYKCQCTENCMVHV